MTKSKKITFYAVVFDTREYTYKVSTVETTRTGALAHFRETSEHLFIRKIDAEKAASAKNKDDTDPMHRFGRVCYIAKANYAAIRESIAQTRVATINNRYTPDIVRSELLPKLCDMIEAAIDASMKVAKM